MTSEDIKHQLIIIVSRVETVRGGVRLQGQGQRLHQRSVPSYRHGVRFPPLSVHLSTIMYRLRCDVWRTIFVPKLCLCGQTVSPYHAIFKCPALAGHFKPIIDKLRLLNLPPDLSSLCRLRDDAGWGLAVDAAKLIFTSGVAAHIWSLFTSAFHRASVGVSARARRAVARPGRPPEQDL